MGDHHLFSVLDTENKIADDGWFGNHGHATSSPSAAKTSGVRTSHYVDGNNWMVRGQIEEPIFQSFINDSNATDKEIRRQVDQIELDGPRAWLKDKLNKNDDYNKQTKNAENFYEELKRYCLAIDGLIDAQYCNLKEFLAGKLDAKKICNPPDLITLEKNNLAIVDTGRCRNVAERVYLYESHHAETAFAIMAAIILRKPDPDHPDPGHPDEVKNIIICTPGHNGDPKRIDIYAGPEWRDLLMRAMHRRLRQKHRLSGTRAWFRGRSQLHLRIETLDGAGSPALMEYADFILQQVVIGARPVLSWRANFIQPLRMERGKEQHDNVICHKIKRLRNSLEPGTWKLDYLSDELSSYLLPYVRNELASDNPPVTYLAVPENLTLRIAIGVEKEPLYEKPFVFPIQKLRLHFFHRDAFALEWVLGESVQEEPKAEKLHKGTWAYYMAKGDARTKNHVALDEPRRSLAQAMDIVSRSRFIFSTNIANERNAGGKKTKISLLQGDDEIGTLNVLGETTINSDRPQHWFRVLLARIFENEDILDEIRIVGDNRARVIPSIILAGGSPDNHRLRPTLARLQMADEWGKGYFYDSDFSQKELAAGYYDRFGEYGSHFLASDHCFAFLGFGDYAQKVIDKQMDDIYRPIATLIPLYSAALDSYQSWLNQIVNPGKGAEPDPAAFACLHQKLIPFRNTLLFDRVSSQVQGRELYELIRNASPVPGEIRVLDSEVARLDNYFDQIAQKKTAQRETESNERMRFLTSAGVSAAIFFATVQLIDILYRPGIKSLMGGLINDWQLAALAAVLGWGALLSAGIVEMPEWKSQAGRWRKYLQLLLFWSVPLTLLILFVAGFFPT